ncbi:MAG: V4R domain-containing protein [Thermoproteota archaeon]
MEAPCGLKDSGCRSQGEYQAPLNLGRLMVLSRGQKWCGVVLETEVGKDVVRRLGELAENQGILIRFIQVSMVEDQEPFARAVAFLDFSNANVTPEEALKAVRKQEFVRRAYIIYPSPEGILYDDYFFPLVVGGQRALIFRRNVYGALVKGVRAKLGTAGEVTLYYQGLSIGYELYYSYAKTAGTGEPKVLIDLLKAYAKTLGWGEIEVVKTDLKTCEAQLRVYESCECEIGKGSEQPYSHIVRGILAGFFSLLFGREAKAIETMCIAKGDPYCEFTVKT